MSDHIILAKVETIERCVLRARGALDGSADFLDDLDAQDIAVVNVIRACEACIDIALRLIKLGNFGLPSTNGDGLILLARSKIIDRKLADKMTKMVGFRNVAVHQYTKLNYDIVASVIRQDMEDVLRFAGIAITQAHPPT